MKKVRVAPTLLLVASMGLLASLALGCQKQGERSIEYEYVYRGASPVAVGSGDPLALDASPSMGPANAKVVIIESSDFQ